MIQLPLLTLDEIAELIRTVWTRTKDHQLGAWAGYFETGHLLHEARGRFASNKDYGSWFRAGGFGFTRQWGNRLERLAGAEPEARDLLESALSHGVDGVLRELRERRAPPAEILPLLPPSVDLRQGDFREVLADLPDASVDLILTDPPYPAEFLSLWSDLGAFAARVLGPAPGVLVAMSGQHWLPEVMARLGEHLRYRWTMACLMHGGTRIYHDRRVRNDWKPFLVYGARDRLLRDVVSNDVADKQHHDWGQGESGMAAVLRQLADPGQLVVDPFAGGGTTAVVALAHGCSFIGAEIDPDTHARAVARIAA